MGRKNEREGERVVDEKKRDRVYMCVIKRELGSVCERERLIKVIFF